MHICFVVEGYPIPEDPFMPFIRELAVEMVKQGVKCSVIAPQSLTRALSHRLPLRPKIWRDYIFDGNYIEVYQPCFISLSNMIPKLYWFSMTMSARKAFKKISVPVDYIHISGIWELLHQSSIVIFLFL